MPGITLGLQFLINAGLETIGYGIGRLWSRSAGKKIQFTLAVAVWIWWISGFIREYPMYMGIKGAYKWDMNTGWLPAH